MDFAVTHTDLMEHEEGGPVALPPEPATVDGGAGAIQARGLIAAPDACDDLGARLEPGDSALTLRVIVRGSRGHLGGCGGVAKVALIQWQARIAPLDAGTYRVRVLYDPGTRLARARDGRAARRLSGPRRVGDDCDRASTVAELVRRGGHDIIGISRSPERVSAPVEGRLGDYDRPETLAAAYAGLDRLLLIPNSEMGPQAAREPVAGRHRRGRRGGRGTARARPRSRTSTRRTGPPSSG